MGPRLFIKSVLAGIALVMALGMAAPASAQGMFEGGMFDPDLIQAIRNGDNVRVEAELFATSPNKRTGTGVPAIVVAAEVRNEEALDLLIGAGARIDNRDRDDRTALGIAARLGELGMVRALLEAGADPEYQGEYRETPLLKAARQGHLEVVRTLLEAGAEADTSDLTGRTALEFAQEGRHRDVIELLEEHGAY